MYKGSIPYEHLERSTSIPAKGEFKLVAITCGFVLAIVFSVIASLYLSSFMENGAYKAVVWFLILIFDSNITSKYFCSVVLHR